MEPAADPGAISPWAEPQEVERELDPYGLVLKAGVWHLVAATEGAVRTYRVSSILRLDIGEDGFDLAAHWRDYLDAHDARRLRLQASVRIAPVLLAALPDRLDGALVRAVETSAGPPDADGWVTATVPLESVGPAVPMLPSLGAGIEVLAPAELRREMAETAAAVLDRYRSGAPAAAPAQLPGPLPAPRRRWLSAPGPGGAPPRRHRAPRPRRSRRRRTPATAAPADRRRR
ncbi:WYL domain-containing protein [Streptomyces sp. NPDC001922]|uniref:WYL domain-containing protein n=1 Tax=Streptomyces sp. NPDC001922 TaxID=3364624 RepID=UPI00369F14BF